MDEEIGKNRAIYSKDRIVKRLLENRELRAEFFKSTIAELKDKTREEIMSWMEDDGDSPKGLNTENVLPNGGMVRYDALYRVKIPSEGDLGIYVNIEAQGQNSALEQDCRSVTYCGTLLSLQVADLGRRRGYRYLDRVYSIWICLDPPKERKGSVYVGRVWMKEADTDGPLEMMRGNLLNIVYVNLRGNGEETDSAATRLMGILLGDLPERKKLDLIRDRFNIDLGDGYTEGVNTNFIYQDAYEEGF